MAAKAGVLAARTEVMPIMEGLARTLEKIHCEKNLTIITDGPAEAAFRGEKQDCEEALGNLLDNACRFASTTVRATAILEPSGRPSIHADRQREGRRARPAPISAPEGGAGCAAGPTGAWQWSGLVHSARHSGNV